MKIFMWMTVALLALRVSAADLDAAAAEKEYQAGRFAEAAAAYQAMVDGGVREASVFYNLGNCLHRLGRPGESVLAYRRAQHLDPADADIEANLRFVQEQARVELAEPPGTLRRLLLSAPANLWVIASMAGWWGALGMLAVARWRRVRPAAGPLVVLGALLLAGTGATALRLSPGGRDEAVALQPSIARFSPLESAEPHFQLSPGAIVRLEARQGVAGWFQVRNGDKTGWVPADRMGRVAE